MQLLSNVSEFHRFYWKCAAFPWQKENKKQHRVSLPVAEIVLLWQELRGSGHMWRHFISYCGIVLHAHAQQSDSRLRCCFVFLYTTTQATALAGYAIVGINGLRLLVA